MSALTLTLNAVPPAVKDPPVSAVHLVSAQTLSTGNTYTSAQFQVASFSWVRYHVIGVLTGTTSPTFDFKVQSLGPDGATWDDIAHDAQQSATFNRLICLPNSVSSGGQTPATSLAAGSFEPGNQGLGSWHRLVITVGGTNTSFATDVYFDGGN